MLLPVRDQGTSVYLVYIRDAIANIYGLVQIEVTRLLRPAHLGIRAKYCLKILFGTRLGS